MLSLVTSNPITISGKFCFNIIELIPILPLLQISGGFATEPAGEAGAEEGGAAGAVRMRNLVVGHEPTDMRKQLCLLP